MRETEVDSMFFVEGYDKDNDAYEVYYETEDFEKAKEVAIILDKIAMKDQLVRYTSDFTKEPIDEVYVTDEQNFKVFSNREYLRRD